MNSGTQTQIIRPPIVVVMGHIDHGKSTLLDYIRKSKVAEGEAGGITQHISAYEVAVSLSGGEKRKIVFLDTPGHEAFHSVRKSGTKVADIAILVVSAEEGVKSQTIEVINRIKEDGLPFIIAINKIDRPGANVDKVKQELAEQSVFVEGWGGTVPVVAISAKSGEGVEDLLETIILQGDLEGLRGDPNLPAGGFVLESHRDPNQGVCATLIIKEGTLKNGCYLVAGGASTPVRAIEDPQGKPLESASLSAPVRVTGWNDAPVSGIEFNSYDSKQEALRVAENYEAANEEDVVKKTVEEGDRKIVPLVIKSDALGSLSALEHELEKLSAPRINIKIIGKGIGPINESDVKTASSSTEILLIGFNVGPDNPAKDLALRNGVEIKTFDIIYKLIDWVKEKLEERTPREEVEEVTGTVKILKIFSVNKSKQIIGGVVESGEIQSNETVKIMRRTEQIGEGKIRELQSKKMKTSLVEEGSEFGMMIESKIEIVAGDKILGYKKVTK